MNSEDYIRHYLAQLSINENAGADEPLERFCQDMLRLHSYPRDTSSTLASMSKSDLLRVIEGALGITLNQQKTAADLKADFAEPLRRSKALEQELERLRGELASTRHQLILMQSSHSWRLTSPLRRLSLLGRRFSRRRGQN